MDLHGKNFIGGNLSSEGSATLSAVNPTSVEQLQPLFHEANEPELNRALSLAEEAFETYRGCNPAPIAEFLERIAKEILDLGDSLIERAQAETALPQPRLLGERGRT